MVKKEVKIRQMQVRASDDAEGESLHVEGYAVVFDEKTLLWESSYTGTKYYEVIARGAIDANTDMNDVILRYNHSDSALILARTSNGTLRLSVDEKGLKVDADIAPTTVGKDIYQLIKRGDISKMSFAFTSNKDSWENDSVRKTQTRRIEHIDYLMDVSPVDFPAYDGTSVEARAQKDIVEELKQKEQEEELRKKLIVKTFL